MPLNNLKWNSAWGASLLFVLVYAFAYGPYFLYAPLPDVQQDSYIYFWAAGLIRDGIIPFPKFTVDVPVGHPVFVWAVKSVTGKTGDVIVAQNLLFIASCIYAVFCFGKLKKAYAWIAAIALSLYSIDNFTMRINTALYSECVYSTLLIFVTARLVMFFVNKTPSTLGILVFSLLLPGLVRPNGIFVFFLLAPIALYIWANRMQAIYTYTLVGSFLLTLLVWSGINYGFKGVFLPGDPYRISAVLNKYQGLPPVSTPSGEMPETMPKAKLFWKNLSSVAGSKPSFYFTYIPNRYGYLYRQPMYSDPEQKIFNRFPVDSAAPGLKKYLFAEYMDTTNAPKNIPQLCNLASTGKSRWMFLNHIVYKLYDLAIWNYLWVVAFCITGLWLLTALFPLKAAGEIQYLLLSLFSMHLVSVFVVTVGHGGFQTRYPHVTELFLFLAVLLTIYQTSQTFLAKKQFS